ncbi:MAG: hypothetical protein WC662_03505 [Candidatus Paceibacterota bacterium]|jgi:hypothetical protein
MKTLLNLVLIGFSSISYQDNSGPGRPDKIFAKYFITMLLYRSIITKILMNLAGQIVAFELNLEMTFLITYFFISVSDGEGIDWSGKKEASWISKYANWLPIKLKEINWISKYANWLPIVLEVIIKYVLSFVCEPLLLYFFSKNGSKTKFRRILSFSLLLLSLAFASFIWVKGLSIF